MFDKMSFFSYFKIFMHISIITTDYFLTCFPVTVSVGYCYMTFTLTFEEELYFYSPSVVSPHF